MSELEKMLRRVLDEALTEKLQPVNERLDGLEQGQAGLIQRMDTLEQGQAELKQDVQELKKGQRKLQKDVSEVKLQLKGVWEDILRLDNRLINQEKLTGSR